MIENDIHRLERVAVAQPANESEHPLAAAPTTSNCRVCTRI